jgi:ferrous iron transport protein B
MTRRKIALVGNPNVGKSVLFSCLTGTYATVSNYPGTTVEVSRGRATAGQAPCEVIDTPGLYSLYPVTEDERVALRIIAEEPLDLIVHVIDAKNLERMLPLTLALLDRGLPLIVALNMYDEAREKGIAVDTSALSQQLGVPVIATVAVEGQGIDQLLAAIEKQFAARRHGEPGAALPPFSEAQMRAWHAKARAIAEETVHRVERPRGLSRLDRVLISPLTGLPILAAVVYLLLYQFVGVLGAGVIVDFLERGFQTLLNPWMERIAAFAIPWPTLRELFVGEYGIFTLGIRYAVAIILPIVAFYFFAFAIIEDSGYLPRLSFLLDRAFKRIGLSGRAIIPMVLGLGCVSMATMTTRTLPSRRERIIATLLLALCIPCAAQTGVIMGLLAPTPAILALWAGIIISVFILVGAIVARALPGLPPSFIIEVPPMRVPKFSNLLTKTGVRVVWYFKEVVPLFILASLLLWLGKITGAFDAAVRAMAAPLAAMGLPPDAAAPFLFGFFRRDYGAAGLYDLARQGALTHNQLLIAVVALTLFLPCITQFLITIKERGLKIGLALSVFIFAFAFTTGVVLHAILQLLNVQL